MHNALYTICFWRSIKIIQVKSRGSKPKLVKWFFLNPDWNLCKVLFFSRNSVVCSCKNLSRALVKWSRWDSVVVLSIGSNAFLKKSGFNFTFGRHLEITRRKLTDCIIGLLVGLKFLNIFSSEIINTRGGSFTKVFKYFERFVWILAKVWHCIFCSKYSLIPFQNYSVSLAVLK